jgi:hypothetical protein
MNVRPISSTKRSAPSTDSINWLVADVRHVPYGVILDGFFGEQVSVDTGAEAED